MPGRPTLICRLGPFIVLGVLLLLAFAHPVTAQPAGSRRVALVIGNAGYRNVDRLANPANDARLMARTLQASGFALVGDGPQLDLSKPQFDRLVQQFGRALQGADVALFYYSGHGMQVAGTNWLVPVDASPTGSRDLDFQAVDANLVLRQMEGAGTRLNLMILDACRNNPFAVRGVRASGGGLAEMRAPEGTLISYATQPGNVAADGGGTNSPYTAALAAAMRQPGLDVFRVFNQVGLSVKEATGGQQQPWLASSPISGNFYFYGPVTITPQVSEEVVFWQSVAGSRNPGDLQAYLRRYPNGTFAELAQQRLAGLAAQQRPSSQPAASAGARPGAAGCVVPAFRGSTQAGGVAVQIQVAAGGPPCMIRTLAVFEPPTSWDRIEVSDPARFGAVQVAREGFTYQSRPGYVGEDSFAVTSYGRASNGAPLVGRMRFGVTVVAQ